jgi:prepilin-type N-terminal cleavage/methylation domain-containing protein
MNHSNPSRASKGFTLVELLVVMAIITLLAALAGPGIIAMVKAPKIDQAVTSCTSALEWARQYAVANNTYTWVAFYQDNTDATGSKVYIAILASADGTDPTAGFTVTGTVPAANYNLLYKITAFPQISLESAGANTWSGLSTPTPTPSSLANNVVNFSLNVPAKGASEQFNQVLQFSPAGEARVSSGLVSLIELGLSPVKGPSNSLDTHNVAVLRVAGMTGQATLYRP